MPTRTAQDIHKNWLNEALRYVIEVFSDPSQPTNTRLKAARIILSLSEPRKLNQKTQKRSKSAKIVPISPSVSNR